MSAQSKGVYLGSTETAAMIRKLFKREFPACRFSVTTGRGSMVSSVHIKWTDGPTLKRVKELTDRFEAGYFDGMTDSYQYDRDAVLLIDGTTYQPGCRFIFTTRAISPTLANKCIALVAAWWGEVESIPVAVAGYDGYKLDNFDPYKPVRPDLDRTSCSWYAQIHECAENRQRFVREGVA